MTGTHCLHGTIPFVITSLAECAKYRIAGKFDEELNLVVWQLGRVETAKLDFARNV